MRCATQPFEVQPRRSTRRRRWGGAAGMVEGPSTKLASVAAQIDATRPPDELAPGFGRTIEQLATWVEGLERGSFGIVGLGEHDATVADLAALAERARGVLVAWRTKLGETHGEEGRDAVRLIAARCGAVFVD